MQGCNHSFQTLAKGEGRMFMTFKPIHYWHKDKKALATRIAQIIGWTDGCPPYLREKEDDTNWVLNSANDWWLTFNPDGNCQLRYRYGWTEEQWKALQIVIEKLVCS
jgi:hypothetical protein